MASGSCGRALALGGTIAALEHRLDLAGRRALQVARERVARAAAALDDLSPLAVLLDAYLVAPDGTILDAAAAIPNFEYYLNPKDVLFRIRLPVLPAQPSGSHAGEWTVVLKLSQKRVDDFLRKFREHPDFLRLLERKSVPYSIIVQSYSDVRMKVGIQQREQLVGDKVELFASLSQYDVPLARRATVRVEITDPSGKISATQLKEADNGRFRGGFATSESGVYRCRFIASGTTFGGQRFTREELRTAPAYRKLPQGPDRGDAPSDNNGRPDRDDDMKNWCRFVECVLQDPTVQLALKRSDVDLGAIKECLAKYCRDDERDDRPRRPQIATQAPSRSEVRREVARLVLPLVRDLDALGIEPALPVAEATRAAVEERSEDTQRLADAFMEMRMRQLQPRKQDGKAKKKKAAKKKGPRRK